MILETGLDPHGGENVDAAAVALSKDVVKRPKTQDASRTNELDMKPQIQQQPEAEEKSGDLDRAQHQLGTDQHPIDADEAQHPIDAAQAQEWIEAKLTKCGCSAKALLKIEHYERRGVATDLEPYLVQAHRVRFEGPPEYTMAFYGRGLDMQPLALATFGRGDVLVVLASGEVHGGQCAMDNSLETLCEEQWGLRSILQLQHGSQLTTRQRKDLASRIYGEMTRKCTDWP